MAEPAVQWFGVMCLVLSILEWRLLVKGNRETLVAMLQALLVGDFVYTAVFVRFVMTAGQWNSAALGTVGITVVLVAFRLYYLFAHPEKMVSWEGEKRPAIG